MNNREVEHSSMVEPRRLLSSFRAQSRKGTLYHCTMPELLAQATHMKRRTWCVLVRAWPAMP
jgi:hypothetical protein